MCKVVLAVLGLLFFVSSGAAIELDFGIQKVLESLSLPLPDPARPIVCLGFGCAYQTPIQLRPTDRTQLKKLFNAATAKSPEAERSAVAAAMAWFEKRVAAEAGTAHAMARAGYGHAGDPAQFDCFDKTSNTIELLAILLEMGLLRHHVIDEPVSRVGVGSLPHTTAVVRERAGGQKWAIDGWTRANGELPDVMPLEKWRSES